MNKLRHMAIFAHIVEAGSITKAAELLDLSKSVVSQHLKALENDLGVVLLKRTTRKQTLTYPGEQFYKQCAQLNHLADEAWLGAQNTLEVPKGKVKITAPHALMSTLVCPAIERLLSDYQQLDFELISSDSHLDLYEHGIDLAIRVGQSSAGSLKQRRIGAFRDVLCGSEQLLNRHDGSDHQYIANHWQGNAIEHRLIHQSSGQTRVFQAKVRCRADTFHACQALIEAGVGVGLLPEFVVRQSSVKLAPVFADYQLPPNTIYALHPFGNQLPLSVSAVLNAIEQKMAEH